MSTAGAAAPDTVKRLVALFDRERNVNQSLHYKEEQLRLACPAVRRSALGVRTFLVATEAPDYTFRIGGRRRRVGLTPAALSATTCP